ncbi:MAG: hypothetical protein JHC33_04025 [Ignisphaera sp.]|nr:hypothetical protein [Ignisphaera sp.]
MRLNSHWAHKENRTKVELMLYDAVNAFYKRKAGLVQTNIKVMPLKRFKALYEPLKGIG